MFKIVFYVSLSQVSLETDSWSGSNSCPKPQMQYFFLFLLAKQGGKKNDHILSCLLLSSFYTKVVLHVFYLSTSPLTPYSSVMYIHIHTKLILVSFSCSACLCSSQYSPSVAASLVSLAKNQSAIQSFHNFQFVASHTSYLLPSANFFQKLLKRSSCHCFSLKYYRASALLASRLTVTSLHL